MLTFRCVSGVWGPQCQSRSPDLLPLLSTVVVSLSLRKSASSHSICFFSYYLCSTHCGHQFPFTVSLSLHWLPPPLSPCFSSRTPASLFAASLAYFTLVYAGVIYVCGGYAQQSGQDLYLDQCIKLDLNCEEPTWYGMQACACSCNDGLPAFREKTTSMSTARTLCCSAVLTTSCVYCLSGLLYSPAFLRPAILSSLPEACYTLQPS